MLLVVIAFIVLMVVCALADWQRHAEAERRIRTIQLSDVDNISGIEFEHYVCRLFKHQGYSANVTQASNDFGVDVIAQLGGDRFAVQIKRYSNKVSRTAISDAVAGKSHYNCNAAMVVTNCYFTKSAKEFARSTACTLVDRDVLSKWILDYQGATTSAADEPLGSRLYAMFRIWSDSW